VISRLKSKEGMMDIDEHGKDLEMEEKLKEA